MSQPGPGRRPRGTNGLIDTAESLAADVGRLGYGLLSLGLGLLPQQSRAHMHNAVRELSHAFVRLPGDFAAIAGEAIEEWAAAADAPPHDEGAPPSPRATAAAAEMRRVRISEAAEGEAAQAAQGPAAAAAAAATAIAAPPVRIAHIEFDPPGRDVQGEYVLLRNTTAEAVDLTGWTLSDGRANHVFVFPAFTLAANAEVKVWTRRGDHDAANLFWGERSAVWNNDGDTGTLKDASGTVVSRLTYAGSR